MRTALDIVDADASDLDRQRLALVREHGWCNSFVPGVNLDDPAYCYTTGFWLSAGYPELIVFSLDRSDAHEVFWQFWDGLQAGRSPSLLALEHDLIRDVDAVLIPVDTRHYRAYLTVNRWFYLGDKFPCLHLVWTDTKGRFPWQVGFEGRFSQSQPDLSADKWAGAIAATKI